MRDEERRRGRRTPINLRMKPEGIAEVDKVAVEAFKGNRSDAARTLIKLGLAAWKRGAR